MLCSCSMVLRSESLIDVFFGWCCKIYRGERDAVHLSANSKSVSSINNGIALSAELFPQA